ncbi:MAG: hypothetical protein K6C95_03075 [Lachnospiraceae bacterium]|nr:hypothetical protein [Lachnospiraceae bacterium]
MKTLTIKEYLFFVYFGLMLWIKGIGLVGGGFYNLILVIGTLIVLVITFMGKTTPAAFAFYLMLLFVAGILPWRIAGDQGPLWCVLFIMAARDMEPKRIASFGAKIWGIAFCVQMITQLTWLRNRDFVIHDKSFGYVIRWAFGYSHPNVFQISYGILVMLLFYIYRPRGKKLILSALIALFGGIWVFINSLSSTGMVFLFAFLIFYTAFDLCPESKGSYPLIVRILTHAVLPAALVFSLVLPLVLEGRAFDVLNRIMSTRYAMTRRFLSDPGPALFGVRIVFGQSEMIDCSFANLLMLGGIVPFILMCAAYIFTVQRLLVKRDGPALAIMIACMIAGMSEPFMFNTSYKNISLIFVAAELGRLIMDQLPKAGPLTDSVYPLLFLENRVKNPAVFSAERIKKLISVIFIAACLLGIIGNFLKPVPETVYALRASCDVPDSLPALHLTEEEAGTIRDDRASWLLNYAGEEAPMQRFTGSIVRIERVRVAVSSVMLAAAACFAAFFMLPREKRIRKKEGKGET